MNHDAVIDATIEEALAKIVAEVEERRENEKPSLKLRNEFATVLTMFTCGERLLDMGWRTVLDPPERKDIEVICCTPLSHNTYPGKYIGSFPIGTVMWRHKKENE